MIYSYFKYRYRQSTCGERRLQRQASPQLDAPARVEVVSRLCSRTYSPPGTAKKSWTSERLGSSSRTTGSERSRAQRFLYRPKGDDGNERGHYRILEPLLNAWANALVSIVCLRSFITYKKSSIDRATEPPDSLLQVCLLNLKLSYAAASPDKLIHARQLLSRMQRTRRLPHRSAWRSPSARCMHNSKRDRRIVTGWAVVSIVSLGIDSPRCAAFLPTWTGSSMPAQFYSAPLARSASTSDSFAYLSNSGSLTCQCRYLEALFAAMVVGANAV